VGEGGGGTGGGRITVEMKGELAPGRCELVRAGWQSSGAASLDVPAVGEEAKRGLGHGGDSGGGVAGEVISVDAVCPISVRARAWGVVAFWSNGVWPYEEWAASLERWCVP
jgi:hypothetical protein